jgi:NAD-dependent dihydropyrimidine dehydrogenase PreA subunit
VRIAAGELTCIRMQLGPADASGRPRPVPVPGSDYTVAADTVIMAIGQEVDLPSASVGRHEQRTAAVDAGTLATSVNGVFAGGDAVLGPASIIDAIAQGRQAAIAMDRFLGGTGAIDRPATAAAVTALTQDLPRGTPRQPAWTISLARRLDSFALVEQAYDLPTARQEASRCLSCDLRAFDVEVNPVVCKDCGYCAEVCGLDVFSRSDQFNAGGYLPAVAARPQRCTGCLNCLYICPDFAITVTQRPTL